ncbi:MAG: site-specific integrase [Streptosporangiaceae bacterium]
MAEVKRRARGEDSIYYDRSRDRWVGTITVGWKPDGRRDRITVRAKTKTEVKDKLRDKHKELAAGVRTPAHYTVEQCLKDWRQTLNPQAASTVTGYRIMSRHLIELIGGIKLADLKARDVQFALAKLAARLSTRSVTLARMILAQAIRNAMVNDLAFRNVAELVSVPKGRQGRPSKSLNLDQALAVLDAAKGERLWPYVAVSMLGGIRTEEARALRWSDVDLEAGTVAVYRSVRVTGETKTEKSRRVFQIPEIAVEALRDLVLKQAAARAKAGTAWKENNLVFCTNLGGPMYATDVRMEFKRITGKAGIGRDWTPRELRHTFVSLLSDSGVPIEQIADAVGHSSTRTTEVVYRHQLRPVTRTAAVALGPLFESKGEAES